MTSQNVHSGSARFHTYSANPRATSSNTTTTAAQANQTAYANTYHAPFRFGGAAISGSPEHLHLLNSRHRHASASAHYDAVSDATGGSDYVTNRTRFGGSSARVDSSCSESEATHFEHVFPLTNETRAAVDAVKYIAAHLKNEDDYSEVKTHKVLLIITSAK